MIWFQVVIHLNPPLGLLLSFVGGIVIGVAYWLGVICTSLGKIRLIDFYFKNIRIGK